MNATTRSQSPILLLDDCPYTRRALSKAIEISIPERRLLIARTLTEAQSLGAGAAVDLFIIDSELPDGSGIDFLADMMMVHEHAHFILLAESRLPEHLETYRWLDRVQVLRKPVDRAQLLAMMHQMLGGKSDQPVAARHGSKKVSCIRLKDCSAEDLVYQRIEACATTVVEFVSRGESGQIHFIHGKAMYAEAGYLEGKDALSKIMSWKSGFAFEIEKEPEPAAPERNQAALIELSPREEPALEPLREKGSRAVLLEWFNQAAASFSRAIRSNRTQSDFLTKLPSHD